LNQDFTFQLLKRLWRISKIRCCADGGANRLYKSLHSNGIEQKL